MTAKPVPAEMGLAASGWEDRPALGALGEELAAGFLVSKGYRILSRNYRCVLGEVDLVAQDGDAVVFVEVKTRRSEEQGLPVDAVTPRKRRQIVKAAYCYLKQRGGVWDTPCRFDVVSVRFQTGRAAELDVIQNAFGEGG